VLIVDANVLVAVMNRRDTHHVRMTALLEARDDEFVVTPYVVAEVAYLVQKFAGADAEIAFMQAIRDGLFRQQPLDEQDLARIVELMVRVPITYATCWYSWRMPPARSRLRMRKLSRSMTFSGRGRSGAAWPRARCGRCAL
jgi:PIN domain-containing protein